MTGPPAVWTEIRTLTSLRFLAALWVVLFHLQALQNTFLAPVFHSFAPIVDNGVLGVDVFFVLSGFILSYTYLDRLGPRFGPATAASFLWARFARMWPAFALVVGVLGLWFLYGTTQHTALDWSLQLKAPDLSPWGLIKQLLMVHLWFSPETDGASWFGPGWTVSAEWLAYVTFPLTALALFRLRRLHPLPALGASVLVLLPVAMIGPGQLIDTYTPYPCEWLVRILCCFLAGGFAYLAVRNIGASRFRPQLAGPATILVAALVLVFLLQANNSGQGRPAVLAFPLIIALLSLSQGRVRSVLGHRWLIQGGRASYSLYLVHMPFIYAFHWLSVDWLHDSHPVGQNLLAVGCLAGTALATYLLFAFVEEPARHRLRKLFPRPAAPNY
ncbi:acyltransferase [Paenarthrobacter sp. Z7-10]|uniref:acyltransferase family protein n=1 Tax=Paenarthrobacter sp. Z7-10 TaxID=2787635 RepID=UPI0022A93F69|nr:acyltransferase [Paenarthrobacter sp. Z7-10]MCZ2403230.1 acyltransferase [Paenarthrobacter sp. Z7-10]